MGFMKFGKKSNMDDSLDIPPPPPMGGDSSDMRSDPGFNNDQMAPPMPSSGGDLDMPPVPDMDNKMPSFSNNPQEHVLPPEQPNDGSMGLPPISGDSFPDMSGGGSLEDSHDILPEKPQQPKRMPLKSFDELLSSSRKQESSSIAPNNQIIDSGAEIFVEVSKYRQFLSELNKVKKSLKESDDEVSELIGDINDEEKTFSKLHSSLTDIEKKLLELENEVFRR